MVVQMLFAGHETTTNLIATGLLDLLRNRGEWEQLVSDPSLTPAAVEELMRFVSPVQFVSRVASKDFMLRSAHVSEGQTVILLIASAHRDPAAFNQPNRLDIHRADAGHQLGFGFGPHFCLGAALARLEAETVLETLSRRFPEMRLDDEEATFHGGAMLRHLKSLWVDFGPERSAGGRGSQGETD
jgi:cytochrome P450